MADLVVFMTGSMRCFWDAWENVKENIIAPNITLYRIIFVTGIDKSTIVEEQIPLWEDRLSVEWSLLKLPEQDLHMKWVDKENDLHHKKAQSSIHDYMMRGKLPPHWYDYLTRRSGSCIEYAQFATLYDYIVKKYRFTPQDLIMRIRTDTLFRYPWRVRVPDMDDLVENVLYSNFPKADFFSRYIAPIHREASILPKDKVDGRWCITLRKNLIYMMPLLSAKVVVDVADHFGDWDSSDDNPYWFNAESQFRGCLRLHNFTVFEFTQNHDECFGNFEKNNSDFPLYAIKRY